MQLTDTFATCEDVVAREVGGDFILLNLTSGTYFGLNQVGGRLWQIVDENACTLAHVCDQLLSEFEADREQIEADILALADDLLEQELLVREA